MAQLDQATADRHIEIINDICNNSYGELSIYHGYSGRGMYGKTCLGVSGPAREVSEFFIKYGVACGQEDVDPIMAWSQDGLGMGVIAYSRQIPSEYQPEEERG